MTTGERMVWAAEFVRARGMGCRVVRAVEMASEAVYSMQLETAEPKDADARAMLDDMLGTGADRVPVRSITGHVVGELRVPR